MDFDKKKEKKRPSKRDIPIFFLSAVGSPFQTHATKELVQFCTECDKKKSL